MAKFKIEISTDNAAFDGDPGNELAFILRKIADAVADGMSPKDYFTKPVRDTNGNTVGKYSFIK